MALTTVTAKGQITIPKSVREALNLRSGDKVEILIEDDRAILKPVSKRVEEVFGKLHQKGKKEYSVEDMHTLVREEIKNKWR